MTLGFIHDAENVLRCWFSGLARVKQKTERGDLIHIRGETRW
jgi:hypothetical protein